MKTKKSYQIKDAILRYAVEVKKDFVSNHAANLGISTREFLAYGEMLKEEKLLEFNRRPKTELGVVVALRTTIPGLNKLNEGSFTTEHRKKKFSFFLQIARLFSPGSLHSRTMNEWVVAIALGIVNALLAILVAFG